MKTKSVNYSKVFNLGDYQNEKIGVELELEPGDDVQASVNRARDFVENQFQLNKQRGRYLEACDHLANPDEYTGNHLKIAQKVKDDYEAMLTMTNSKLLEA